METIKYIFNISLYWVQLKRVALALILLGAIFLAGCGNLDASLEMKVVDTQGNPIGKVTVYIQRSLVANEEHVIRTNENGVIQSSLFS